jgi:hypothetical protein
LYYVNQLLVANALLAVAFVYVGVAVVRRAMLPAERHPVAIMALAWFMIVMILFSFSATKNPHYVVLLLPPAVMTAVYGLERLLTMAPRRLTVGVYGVLVATALWALVPAVRSQLRYAFTDLATALVIVAMVAFVVLPWLLPRRITDRFAIVAFQPVVYGVAALMVLRILWVTLDGHPAEIRGGREIAKIILGGSARSFDYLYHRKNAGDAFQPQLDWYLGGWMSAWKQTKSYTPVALPVESDANLEDVMRTAAQATGTYVVYYHPGNDTYVGAVAEALSAWYRPVELDPASHYALFRRKASSTAP